MIRVIMQTIGQFLAECGARLAPFDRRRVGALGCGVALVAIAAALGSLALGWWAADTIGAGFRAIVLAALLSVIVLFLVCAGMERAIERSVDTRVDAYLRESGRPVDDLVRAVEARVESIRGGPLLLALLKRRARG